MPPDGFDPRAASALELRRYGLPPRPDPAVRPELAAVWDDVFSRKLSYITPVFQPAGSWSQASAGRTARARTRTARTAPGRAPWRTPRRARRSSGSSAQWNVPDVEPGGEGPGSWFAATWIGIDGVTDVTQIGTMQVASKADRGRPTRSGLDFLAEGGAADTVLNMVENGITVATTTIETPTLFKIDYTGAPPPVSSGTAPSADRRRSLPGLAPDWHSAPLKNGSANGGMPDASGRSNTMYAVRCPSKVVKYIASGFQRSAARCMTAPRVPSLIARFPTQPAC